MFKFLKKKNKINNPLPPPTLQDWRNENFEKNILEGVKCLQEGKSINIYEDGRGFELALAIKQRFILEYSKQLSESININHGSSGTINVTLKNKYE